MTSVDHRSTTGRAAGPLRVLDVAMGWAGPFVSYILAEMGAEVIKIEDCRRFDWWRGPHPRDAARNPDGSVIANAHELAAVYNSVNRHKQGVTLDLTTAAGRAALLDLVRVSDVIVENFTPHAMAGLALGYDVIAAVNPQIVMLSMPAFGATGPERDYIGYGMTIEAMAGMTALTGYADGPPQMLSNAYGNPVSGLNGAAAALMALHARGQTGRGCHIEVAQVEGFIPLVAGAILDAHLNGRDGRRSGNRHRSMAPHGVYRCNDEGGTMNDEVDGTRHEPDIRDAVHRSSFIAHRSDPWVAVAVGSDAEWAALCAAIGRPELARDPRFADVVSRKRHEAEAEAMLAAWTCTRTRHEAVAALQEAGVTAAPVQSSTDLLADPLLAARGFFTVVDRAHVGTHLYPGLPFRLDPPPATDTRPAPCLGEHSELVLTSLVGMSADAYAALEADGVTGTEPLP